MPRKIQVWPLKCFAARNLPWKQIYPLCKTAKNAAKESASSRSKQSAPRSAAADLEELAIGKLTIEKIYLHRTERIISKGKNIQNA